MDNNPENDSNVSPTRRVSKRMNLAALRRTSAAATSTQPTDNNPPTTSNSATRPSNAASNAGVTSSITPTASATSNSASSSPASSQSGTSGAPPAASTAQAPTTSSSLNPVSSTNSEGQVSRQVISPPQKRFVHPGEKIPRLTKNPTRAQVMNITNTLLMLDCPFTFVDVIPTEVIPSFETLLQSRHYLDKVARKACLNWRTWTLDQFVYELRAAVPDTAVARPHSSESFYELIAKLPVNFDLDNDSYELSLDSSLQAICAQFPDVTKEDELKAANLLISRLPEQPVNWRAICFRDFNGIKPVIETVEDFRFIWRAQLKRLRDRAQDMRDVGYILQGTDHTKHFADKPIRKRPSPTHSEAPLQKKTAVSDTDTLCTGCGRNNHIVSTCHFKTSPYYNATDKAYTASAAYVELRRDYPTTSLAPSAKYLAEKGKNLPHTSTSSATSQSKKVKIKGALIPDSVYFTTITSPEYDTDYLSVAVSHVSQSLEPPKR